MARERWNRLNLPVPSAVSCVPVYFTPKTDLTVKTLLAENDKVLKLLRSTFLQTEVRVLYGLLYNLNNSSRGNKTFRVLKQVEQCINRLRNMKLDVALQNLVDLCPNRFQRKLSIEGQKCEVPSQPMLEWLCLKVLGAAQLMSCTLKRCSTAFVLSKQHMKHEFIILNMVITSMLSRLWVIFRGVLANLSTLYKQLYDFRGEVAHAQPMPFLTDFCLPADIAHFLGPSDASLLPAKPKSNVQVKGHKAKVEKHKPAMKANKVGQGKKIKEDLGVAVQRGLDFDSDIKPIETFFRNVAKKSILPKEKHKAEKKQMFQRQVRQASTFKDMTSSLDEMILWCTSQKMNKRKRLLTFLRLKCRRLRGIEAAGYNVKKKLQTFKQEACQAFCSTQGPVQKTCQSAAACRTHGRLRTRLCTLKTQLRSSKMRTDVRNKHKQKKCVLSELLKKDDWLSRIGKATAWTLNTGNHDDIDDIFTSAGL
ncbi:nucleolus and neural progenitor protein isoform X2 [Dunckerocampus dactyliophorus]|uniref:nucleolus and neural progenitor protein isoform X2 n=1 Tax=Dunckerocampus dactyliophorus TaxID=161453 RepID=UPI002406F9EB|nr:nucleolus and neural progenitor protein isoform X2 [Dunckerocampus dactyliophorus]